jgi:hypothetical protein
MVGRSKLMKERLARGKTAQAEEAQSEFVLWQDCRTKRRLG